MHVYRWDLDKTYLDTDIHSVRGLIRTAFESAKSKRNVPGAAAMLRALTVHDPSARVHILSGSPTQMRQVLSEKLDIDGVRYDSLTLKDNLGNLRRGRLRAVTGQIGYKLPRLLEQRVGLGPSVHETLFGDDSEADAVVYSVYADAIAGRIDPTELARILEVGGAYSDAVRQAVHALEQVGEADAVEDIFIVLGKGVPVERFRDLGSRVIPVFSWLQAAVTLLERNRLDKEGVVEVARACTTASSMAEQSIIGLLQDAQRRGLVTRDTVDDLLPRLLSEPMQATARRALDRLGSVSPRDDAPSRRPDYVRYLRQMS